MRKMNLDDDHWSSLVEKKEGSGNCGHRNAVKVRQTNKSNKTDATKKPTKEMTIVDTGAPWWSESLTTLQGDCTT